MFNKFFLSIVDEDFRNVFFFDEILVKYSVGYRPDKISFICSQRAEIKPLSTKGTHHLSTLILKFEAVRFDCVSLISQLLPEIYARLFFKRDVSNEVDPNASESKWTQFAGVWHTRINPSLLTEGVLGLGVVREVTSYDICFSDRTFKFYCSLITSTIGQLITPSVKISTLRIT